MVLCVLLPMVKRSILRAKLRQEKSLKGKILKITAVFLLPIVPVQILCLYDHLSTIIHCIMSHSHQLVVMGNTCSLHPICPEARVGLIYICLLYTSPSPRDGLL